MIECTSRQAAAESRSLIEQVPPQAGPSALTLVGIVDGHLAELEAEEKAIGRSTSYLRWRREKLLQRREQIASMVN